MFPTQEKVGNDLESVFHCLCSVMHVLNPAFLASLKQACYETWWHSSRLDVMRSCRIPGVTRDVASWSQQLNL